MADVSSSKTPPQPDLQDLLRMDRSLVEVLIRLKLYLQPEVKTDGPELILLLQAIKKFGLPPRNALDELKQRLDTRLNNHLVEMEEGWDDSIVGFNQAWQIMDALFQEVKT